MKEDCYEPDVNYRQILSKIMVGSFHDLRYMSDPNPNFVAKSNYVYFNSILNKEKFQDFVYSRLNEQFKDI